jgi:ABC-type glutathione transport system ATPase component
VNTKADSGSDGRDAAIRVNDLSVEYPAHGPSGVCEALRGISVDVQRTEVLGLMGETGSGKSTLARILSGRLVSRADSELPPRITGGDAIVLGRSVRRARRRHIAEINFHVGYLEQDAADNLTPSMTVLELVCSPIYERDRGFDSRAATSRAANLIDVVHLPLSVLDKYPYELSSGQRQRVAIARSLVLGPSVLIADEPAAGIDATVRDAVMDIFAQLKEHVGFTGVVITHDLSLLRKVSDRVAVLHQGSLVGYGPLAEVLADPQHPYVAELAHALLHDQS